MSGASPRQRRLVPSFPNLHNGTMGERQQVRVDAPIVAAGVASA
jgi:hypothetical protein